MCIFLLFLVGIDFLVITNGLLKHHVYSRMFRSQDFHPQDYPGIIKL